MNWKVLWNQVWLFINVSFAAALCDVVSQKCVKMAVFLYIQSLCTSWQQGPGARDPRRIWEHWREAKLLLRGFELQ